ncbi:MAG: ABC transporter ATP-binding protein [Actinomycetota bacterium]|nr:ABC transporter ATP-binding protein [Actinomycetota bacterium]
MSRASRNPSTCLPPEPARSVVEATGLVRSHGAVTAVQGIDLHLGAGETVALLGANGAGKSTTIDLLLGLAEPDAGTVTVVGLPPRRAVAAGKVGGMLQSGWLIRHLTVREVVTMVASLYPAPLDVDTVLARTGTAALASRRTGTLSGGQAQRVRLALAIVGDPELLVLDEPTVALDVEARHELWAVVRDLATSGRTVLFATHHLDEADAFADRVVVLAAGRVVACGSPAEISARIGTRRITATLHEADPRRLGAIRGVRATRRRGPVVELDCDDADTALRELLAAFPDARDLEVRGSGLEAAFLELAAVDDARTGGGHPHGNAGALV